MNIIDLNDGNKIPMIGFGVYQIPVKDCQKCVEDAIEVGYRLIDTAQAYFNEQSVGNALKSVLNGGLKREELFITTKLWITDMSQDDALSAFEVSLKKLKLDYVDLYLLHKPYGDYLGAWKSLIKLKKEGLIKSIGVSNFSSTQISDFCANNEIIPAVNQIECNPFYQRNNSLNTLNKFNIICEGYSPFGEGNQDIFNNEILKKIAKNYDKSVAQVILRWLLQRNIIAVQKTSNKTRMIENFNIFDFELSDDEMSEIKKLDHKKSSFF